MIQIWFDVGVVHRHAGANTSWARKARRLQAAIILAANRHRADIWELLKPEWQSQYLHQADRLLAAGAQTAGQGPAESDLPVDPTDPPLTAKSPSSGPCPAITT